MIHPENADLRDIAAIYQARRQALREAVGEGLIVIPAHPPAWRNADNPYPYRQSSHFLYLAPIHRPGLALILDADGGDILFGPPEDPDDLIWHGPHPSLADEARTAGVTDVRDLEELPGILRNAQEGGRTIHLLPSFVPGSTLRLASWLGVEPRELDGRVSSALVHALGELRLRKSRREVEQIEEAVAATTEMIRAAFRAAKPGVPESVVRGAMAHVAFAHGMEFSFSPIVTVRGEVLHNAGYDNLLAEGQLLLVDAGLETRHGYASDITRTIPVTGRFSPEQRAVYDVVLAAQEAAIGSMRPGVSFRDVHRRASRVIAGGLTEIGLMRGNPDAAVDAGAHALFFVHGLGHPLGLDVHDVHDLGDAVAYPPERPRGEQFGLRYLRFGRDLEEDMVMTVEPGIYFIPTLIDRWRTEGRYAEFIDYERLERFRDFGGIRIEDDVLVTEGGVRVLGPGIPRSPDELEDLLAR
jgi:Xaa-Pro aminopeptidase